MLMTALVLCAGSTAANACLNLTASATCAPIAPGPGLETWKIQWNDTGCCTTAKIYVQDGCSGGFSLAGEVACGAFSYNYVGSAGSNNFLVELWDGDTFYQSVETGCVTCD